MYLIGTITINKDMFKQLIIKILFMFIQFFIYLIFDYGVKKGILVN